MSLFQDSVLDRLLHNLFFNDTQSSLRTHFILYADNTYTYASVSCPYSLYSYLLTHIGAFMDLCNLWRFNINESKLCCIFFKKNNLSKEKLPKRNITVLTNTVIFRSNDRKYPKIILDQKIT